MERYRLERRKRVLNRNLKDYEDPLDFSEDIFLVADFIYDKKSVSKIKRFLYKRIRNNKSQTENAMKEVGIPVEVLNGDWRDYIYDNKNKVVKLIGMLILQDLGSNLSNTWFESY